MLDNGGGRIEERMRRRTDLAVVLQIELSWLKREIAVAFWETPGAPS